MTAAVLLESLTKSYGKNRGVADLDLEVEPGCVFGFLGPNGAGKTTTIRMLCSTSSGRRPAGRSSSASTAAARAWPYGAAAWCFSGSRPWW